MTTATATEVRVLTEMIDIARQARGDHPALAEVRRQTAREIDSLLATLASHGVDTAALLDQIDPEED